MRQDISFNVKCTPEFRALLDSRGVFTRLSGTGLLTCSYEDSSISGHDLTRLVHKSVAAGGTALPPGEPAEAPSEPIEPIVDDDVAVDEI